MTLYIYDDPLVTERKKSWRGRWIGGEQRRSTKQRPKRNIWLKSMMHCFVIHCKTNSVLTNECVFLREKIEINKSYVNEVVQNIKRVSRGSEKRCFCLYATQVFTSFCVCSLRRPRQNAMISWWSSTMGSCRRSKIWNQRFKRLINLPIPQSPFIPGCVWSLWLSDVNASFVLQLQGAVEADFQEKFHCLPGEIQEFLQERRAEVRGNSKSRPSTPHETLSEEDWGARKCVRTSGGHVSRWKRTKRLLIYFQCPNVLIIKLITSTQAWINLSVCFLGFYSGMHGILNQMFCPPTLGVFGFPEPVTNNKQQM